LRKERWAQPAILVYSSTFKIFHPDYADLDDSADTIPLSAKSESSAQSARNAIMSPSQAYQ